MIEGIHHFAIIVSSENTVAFYERLGFKEYKRIVRKRDAVILLYGHGVQMEVFVDSSHPPRTNPEPLGFRHVALRVDRIEETIKELGLGMSLIKNDWSGLRFCFISDPDGNIVELHE